MTFILVSWIGYSVVLAGPGQGTGLPCSVSVLSTEKSSFWWETGYGDFFMWFWDAVTQLHAQAEAASWLPPSGGKGNMQRLGLTSIMNLVTLQSYLPVISLGVSRQVAHCWIHPCACQCSLNCIQKKSCGHVCIKEANSPFLSPPLHQPLSILGLSDTGENLHIPRPSHIDYLLKLGWR